MTTTMMMEKEGGEGMRVGWGSGRGGEVEMGTGRGQK